MSRLAIVVVGVVVSACSYQPSFAGLDAGDDAATLDALACEPIGHDEDGDGLDDACDPCPGIANATEDRDGDGIADACDPDPDDPRDRRRDFVSFSEPDAQDRWQIINSGWSWGDGALRFTGPACCNYQVVKDTRPPFPQPIAVDARFVVEAAPGGRGHLGFLLNVNGPGDGGVACAIVRESGGDSVVFVNDPVGARSDRAVLSAPIANASDYRLVFEYFPVSRLARCRVDGGPGVQITLAAAPPSGPLGFEAMGMVARVAYLSVYGRD
jgi:hypothetical protein